MDIRYSFLKDELAIQEIRKHKWIESEKQGNEIGFATAALDWIHKYGNEWKQFRLKSHNAQHLFEEKRRQRRFSYQWPVEIKIAAQHAASLTTSVNLTGFSCLLSEPIAELTPVIIRMEFERPGSSRPLYFQFKSRISRLNKSSQTDNGIAYKAFIPFTEEVRDYLRIHGPSLANLEPVLNSPEN
ncbi:MAG: hypothetical protein Q7S13_06465 [Candidatus Omnitrophota bacterium]|nr:hypothetical protein [Candidatus Omnitrophota bacterium]